MQWHLNNNRFLFFDTRVTSEMIAKDADINLKTEGLLRDQPLRLAFSGRLLSIKGVDHLPLVAAELKRRQILFTMDIFGGGEYEPKLRRDIAKYDLTKEVTLHGVVDFKTQLMPRINKNTDLFVCCHRQGDPSCTYLETLACGTPIVGYGNEAFLGLLQYGDFGWSSPINDPIALADQIGKINRDRQNLAKAMKTARNFAMQHSFEVTFSRRIEHIQQCS
jgi:colanic acid/amylovoran biosynthesis glycosyltransferase